MQKVMVGVTSSQGLMGAEGDGSAGEGWRVRWREGRREWQRGCEGCWTVVCHGACHYKEDVNGTCHYEGGSMASGLYEWVDNMIRDICNTEGYERIVTEAKVNISTTSISRGGLDMSGTLSGAMTAMNQIMVSVAITVFCILWLISLASSFMQQQAYAELIVKKLIGLGLGIGLIGYSMTICSEICNLGANIAAQVGSVADPAAPNTDEIIASINRQMAEEGDNIDESVIADVEADAGDEVKQLNFLQKWAKDIINKITKGLRKNVLNPMSVGLSLIFPWLMIKVSTALVSVFTITRAVEILVLCVMSPLPFAFIANEPFGNGSGMRFLKHLAALSLQGAVMIVIAIVCQQMCAGAVASLTADNISKQSWKIIAISFAEVGLLMKSLSISQKAVGLG